MPTGDFQHNEGWVCPKCQTVHAPWVRKCDVCSKTHYYSDSPWIRPDSPGTPLYPNYQPRIWCGYGSKPVNGIDIIC